MHARSSAQLIVTSPTTVCAEAFPGSAVADAKPHKAQPISFIFIVVIFAPRSEECRYHLDGRLSYAIGPKACSSLPVTLREPERRLPKHLRQEGVNRLRLRRARFGADFAVHARVVGVFDCDGLGGAALRCER